MFCAQHTSEAWFSNWAGFPINDIWKGLPTIYNARIEVVHRGACVRFYTIICLKFTDDILRTDALSSVLKGYNTENDPPFCSCPSVMLHSSQICIVSGFTNNLMAERKTVDLDQLASEKLADLDQHCFQNRPLPRSTGSGITRILISLKKCSLVLNIKLK